MRTRGAGAWRLTRRIGPALAGLTLAMLAPATAWAQALPIVPPQDAVASAAPAGDAGRGRAIVANRQLGLCLLCHRAPIPEERFQGNLAPDLAGAGRRWSAQQLRERLVDPARFNPDTIMPAYARTEGLTRVAPAVRGKPLLDAAQIEDVVAWLASLRDD